MRASWSSFVSNVVKAQVMHNHTVPVSSSQFVIDMSSNIIINFRKVLSPKYQQTGTSITGLGLI